jgi:hypothetical protein
MLKEKCYIIARTVNEDDYISGWQEEQGIKVGSTVFCPADRDCFETNKLGEAKIWANKKLAERKLKKEYNDDPTARVIEIELVANI